MKTILSTSALLLIVIGMCPGLVSAQDSVTVSRKEKERIDSVAAAQQMGDAERLSLLKARFKESERVEREAHSATKEARLAYRQEMKAQKARRKADRQAERAARAKNKFDNNRVAANRMP